MPGRVPAAAGGTRLPRTLKSVAENLNNGADRDAEIAASKIPDRATDKAKTPDAAAAAEVEQGGSGGTTPAASKLFNYDEWFAAQPEEARVTFAKNVVGRYEQNVKDHYSPEVFALLEEAGNNPELLKKLQRASKDKDLRTFLFDTAFQIYGDESSTPAELEQKPRYVQELETQLQSIQAERTNEKIATVRQQYEQQRTQELVALQREYPELRFDQSRPESPEYLRVMDIIDRTEAASQRAGKVLSYKDTYDGMRKAWGAQDTTAQKFVVPGTTPTTGVAAPRQAPQNDKDARVRMRETLDRNGGSLSSLAAALARK